MFNLITKLNVFCYSIFKNINIQYFVPSFLLYSLLNFKIMKKIGILFFSLGVIVLLSAFISQSEPWDIPDEYMKMENPTTADKESLAIGKQLYNKHCKSCHGAEGYGDGSKADEVETAMPDLATEEYKAQKDGVKYYKSFIGRGDMPNYEKKIPDEEDRWFVINYMDQFE